MNDPYYYNQFTPAQAKARESTLMQRVAYLLCTTLLVTAATAWWAGQAHLSPALFLPLAIGTFACVFGVNLTRRQPMLSLVLLYALSALEGMLLGPMLASIVRGYALGSVIIGEAAGLSAILMAGLGSYVWISNRDFGGLGKTLFWALLALIVVGFIGMFVHFGAGGELLYSVIGAVIFAGFTLYDFSNIKRRYGPDDYAIATVSLYLDFLNLFLFLLRILMIFSGGGGGRRD